MSNNKTINEAIEALPICSDGKRGVRELVRALGHEVKEDKLFSRGEIWTGPKGGVYVITKVPGEEVYNAVSVDTGFVMKPENMHKLSFGGSNLYSYLQNGGKI